MLPTDVYWCVLSRNTSTAAVSVTWAQVRVTQAVLRYRECVRLLRVTRGNLSSLLSLWPSQCSSSPSLKCFTSLPCSGEMTFSTLSVIMTGDDPNFTGQSRIFRACPEKNTRSFGTQNCPEFRTLSRICPDLTLRCVKLQVVDQNVVDHFDVFACQRCVLLS